MKDDISWRWYFEIFEIIICLIVMKKKCEWNWKKLVLYGFKFIYIFWMLRLNKKKMFIDIFFYGMVNWLCDFNLFWIF